MFSTKPNQALKLVEDYVSKSPSIGLARVPSYHSTAYLSQGGVDSTQFKAKKTVFRQAEKSENGQPVRVTVDGYECSTYQYLGTMQMKVSRGRATRPRHECVLASACDATCVSYLGERRSVRSSPR